MEQEIKKFMENHQMIGNSDACNYHMALGFYYAYSADAYRLAEMLEMVSCLMKWKSVL